MSVVERATGELGLSLIDQLDIVVVPRPAGRNDDFGDERGTGVTGTVTVTVSVTWTWTWTY